MSPIHDITMLALGAAIAASMAITGCQDGASSGGSGGAGAGASVGTGNVCGWDGTGGGVTIPDCSAYRYSINLVGVVDGNHYDQLWMEMM